MQAKLVSNIAQYQRPHGNLTVYKEVFLPLDHRPGNAKNRVKALLDVLDKPARLLQALLQGLVSVRAFVAAQRAGVNVVHAKFGHHVGVEPHAELHAALQAAAHPAHQYIGDDGVALHVGKAPAWTRLQGGYQRQCGAGLRFVHAAQGRQAAHIAPGQQIQRLLAHRQRASQRVGLAMLRPRLQRQGAQLQREAFRQPARTNAGGLQALQQMQGDGETVHQFVPRFAIVTRQARGQFVEWVFEVAVLVQRFDQKMQRRAVQLRQAQRERLAVQKVAQGAVFVRQVDGVCRAVLRRLGAACRRFTTPFAIVGGHVNRAVARPIQGVLHAGEFSIIFGFSACWTCAGSYRICSKIGLCVVFVHRGVGMQKAKLFTRSLVVFALKKRVLVQHLLDFLAQLQRGQLQKPNRLLQLRRKRQVLRDAQGQARVHGTCITQLAIVRRHGFAARPPQGALNRLADSPASETRPLGAEACGFAPACTAVDSAPQGWRGQRCSLPGAGATRSAGPRGHILTCESAHRGTPGALPRCQQFQWACPGPALHLR